MRIAKIEAVADGRMALIAHFRTSTKGNGSVNLTQATAERRVGEQHWKLKDDVFIVLNTHAFNRYHREVWNQQLVLVDNVHLIDSPDSKVPLSVGLYCVENKVMEGFSNLPLFESSTKGSRKFLPRIRDWKPRPFGLQASRGNDFKPQNVEGASKVVVDIPNDKSGFVPEFVLRFMDGDDDFQVSVPTIRFNGDRV